MSLDNIPIELKHFICGYCDIPTIKALRLTCRELNHAAKDHLFSTLVIYMTKKSMNLAIRIASSPEFAKTVRSLLIQFDAPDSLLDFRGWLEALEIATEIQPLSADLLDLYREREGLLRLAKRQNDPFLQHLYRTRVALIELEYSQRNESESQDIPLDANLKEGYKYYQTLVQDYEEMLRGPLMQDTLFEIFKNCPRLTTVEVTSENQIRQTTTKNHAPFERGMLLPHGDPDTLEQGVVVFRKLLRAAALVGFSPKVLRLGSVSQNVLCEERIVKDFYLLLKNIEVFRWDFASAYTDGPDIEGEITEVAEILQEGHFTRLLESAEQLRALHLSLPYFEEVPFGGPSFSMIVRSTTWPLLKRFSIRNVEMGPNDLADFLLRHSQTLESVLLEKINFDCDRWASCFAAFAGKLPQLKIFELRAEMWKKASGALFYWFGEISPSQGTDYGREISRYIVTEGVDFPQPFPDPGMAFDLRHDEALRREDALFYESEYV